jgi:hypothetical protein
MGRFLVPSVLAKSPTLMPFNMATDRFAGLRMMSILRLNGQTMKIDLHSKVPGMSLAVAY